jgi:hypothetical protein
VRVALARGLDPRTRFSETISTLFGTPDAPDGMMAVMKRIAFVNMLLTLNRPADATVCFENALQGTPNRPMVVFGLARAAKALGDHPTARKRYQEFLDIWRTADRDRREVAAADAFLRGSSGLE